MRAPGINLAETPDFDLGTLRISPARRRVRSNGKDLELEPKVAQVLVALASVRPSVVSRDRLIEQCWDGRIVGDDAVNRCIVALRHLAKEFSPEPFAIETVTRVGYSLVETKVDVAAAVPRTGYTKPKLAVVALLVLLLVSIALALSWVQFSRGQAAPASIAVLPFRNLSAGDSYFAEGIAEEIMGQLAREPAFRVAGSASAAQFKGPSDPHEVGRVLGVDYILEGSVRSSEGQVRINASLVRTRDGTRLWSETYDRKLDHVLEIQTAIGQAVASGLSRRLIHSRQASPMNGEAYALYLNARGLLRSGNPQSGRDAIGLLQQVIRLDPTYAPAWSSLANALQLDGRTKGNEGMIAVIPRARAAVGRALRLDPNLAEAHGVSADLIDADSPQGIAHRRRAAELDARSGEGLLWRGGAHEASGEWADGLAAYHRAHDADPVWPVPVRSLVDLTSLLGDRPAAESVAKRGFPDDVAT
jgi:TolB-like protein/DNA-binding winged helix-turn-helix (wHTH) protein